MAQGKEQRIHYIHSLSYTTRERVVGAFVLVALAVIFGLIFINGRTTHLFEKRVTYHAYLNSAQGISTESVVKVSGLEVGRVSGLDIADNNRIHLTLFIYERYHDLVRADSHVALSKLSVLGKASIDITAGTPGSPVLPDGATLSIEEPRSLDELVADLTPVMEKVKRIVEGVAAMVDAVDPKDIKTTSHELAQTMASMRSISSQIASGKGAVGQLVYNDKVEKSVAHSLASLESTLDRADKRLAEMEPVTKNAAAITKELSGLVAESKQLVNQMNTAMGTVNVELQQLPELVSRMKLLMDSTDRTLQGMQRIWPLSSAVPEPKQDDTLIKAQPAND